MYSGKQLRRSVGGVALVTLLALTACTGGTSNGPDAPALSSAPVPTIAHDGRTILPSPGTTACKVVGPEAIRQRLGARATGLQPGQSSGVQDAEGVIKETCIYPLDERGLTTNAVIVEIATYPSTAVLAGADPFALMTAPEDVSGLGDRAKFGMNSLTGTNEFVLAVVSGVRVTRFLVAVPASAADWDKSSGRDVLTSLAQEANF
jgi:hypothetical protein